jgi:hypothetical protein
MTHIIEAIEENPKVQIAIHAAEAAFAADAHAHIPGCAAWERVRRLREQDKQRQALVEAAVMALNRIARFDEQFATQEATPNHFPVAP